MPAHTVGAASEFPADILNVVARSMQAGYSDAAGESRSQLGSVSRSFNAGSSVESEPRTGNGMSLYEYWGITNTTDIGGVQLGPSEDDCSEQGLGEYEELEVELGGDDSVERAAAADRAVEAWFIKAASRLGGHGATGDLDDRREQLSRASDRSIWIVFRFGCDRLYFSKHTNTLKSKEHNRRVAQEKLLHASLVVRPASLHFATTLLRPARACYSSSPRVM